MKKKKSDTDWWYPITLTVCLALSLLGLITILTRIRDGII